MRKDHSVKEKKKKEKKATSTRRWALIMNMLSGQEHPDVLWQLEKPFSFLFFNFRLKKSQMKSVTREAAPTAQLAINAEQTPGPGTRLKAAWSAPTSWQTYSSTSRGLRRKLGGEKKKTTDNFQVICWQYRSTSALKVSTEEGTGQIERERCCD